MARKGEGKTFFPGDLIFSEKPFVFVLFHRLSKELCDFCLNKKETLKACSRCKYVRYCNEICQKAAWLEHKHECKDLKNFGHDYEDIIRLLTKVSIKFKINEDDLQKKAFYDLKFSLDLWKTCYEPVGVFPHPMGDFYNIFLRVDKNKFWIHNRIRPEGYAIYLGASAIRHACIPNAMCVFKGSTIEIRAIEKIVDGDKLENVTVAYFPILDGYHDREFGHHSETFEYRQFLAQCKCKDCSAPITDSILQKTLDSDKADEVIFKSYAYFDAALRSKFVGSLRMTILLDKLLMEQKGVLAETHIHRLRLLALEVIYDIHRPTIALEKGVRLLKCIKQVFGKRSPELIWLYDVLSFVSRNNRNFNEALKWEREMINLCKMYGYEENSTARGPVSNALENLLVNQLYQFHFAWR